jgi:hypothetical protein
MHAVRLANETVQDITMLAVVGCAGLTETHQANGGASALRHAATTRFAPIVCATRLAGREPLIDTLSDRATTISTAAEGALFASAETAILAAGRLLARDGNPFLAKVARTVRRPRAWLDAESRAVPRRSANESRVAAAVVARFCALPELAAAFDAVVVGGTSGAARSGRRPEVRGRARVENPEVVERIPRDVVIATTDDRKECERSERDSPIPDRSHHGAYPD